MSGSESRRNAPRKPSASPKVSPQQISEAAEAAAVHRRKTEASPKREDFEREFGKHRIKDEPDGSWTFTAKDRREIRRAHEMQEGVRKIDVERGYELHSRVHYEKAVNKNGKVVPVRGDQLDIVKKGLRPVGRNGIGGSMRFFLGDAAERYERGPDGLYFVWKDGWEPTNLWRNGAQSPQRDPDGNVWVEANGDWALEDEVA